MGNREDFEKWANSNKLKGVYRPIALQGYQARQPEINALKAGIDSREAIIADASNVIAALKAEVERLRKDAERYEIIRMKVRGQYDHITSLQQICFPVIRPINDVLRGSVAQHLDEALDAMKETK